MKAFIKKHILLCILVIEALFVGLWGMKLFLQKPVELVLSSAVPVTVSLPRGIYEVEVNYGKEQESDGGSIRVYGNTTDERGIFCDSVSFPSQKESITFPFWVNEKEVDGITFALDDELGNVAVEKITIKTAWNSKLYQILCVVLKITLLQMFFFGFLYRDRLRKYSVVIVGILGITLICSLGFFTRYLIMGHDAMFHMNRIEGLKDGLLSGNIPVRIQPDWNYGYGYGVSLMYGDITLLLPAWMRICGFTITASWKTYHVVVNLTTAAVSFYAFYKMSRNKYLSLLTSLLYCTSFYRLACIYIRSAEGEVTAMIFLPLIALFFWYAFAESTEKKDYGTKLVAPVLGFTGMIQTHVLTCEMALLFMVILCLIMYRRMLCRKTLLYFIRVAGLVVLVNLWFLIPFLHMLQEDIVIAQMTQMRDDFQIWGLSITELFATSPSRAYYFTFEQNTSLANKCTLSIGTSLWIGMCFAGLALWNKKLSGKKTVAVLFGMGILAAFMATSLFPYSFLKEHLPVLSMLLGKIQFSYRFLGMASFFFALTFFFCIQKWKQNDPMRKYGVMLFLILGVLASFQGMDYQYELLYGGTFSDPKFSEVSLNTAEVISGEYLYTGSDVERAKSEQTVTSCEVEIQEVKRNGLYFQITGKSLGEGAYLDVPCFYYPGYTAQDQEGNSYSVIRSTQNNRIRVVLPETFDGTLEVFYKEPFSYRICEAVSLAAILILVLGEVLKKHKEQSWIL